MPKTVPNVASIPATCIYLNKKAALKSSASAHTPGNSSVEWKEGCKLDQFTMSLYLDGTSFKGNGVFDQLCDKYSDMMLEDSFKSLHICMLAKNDKDGATYTFSFGVMFNKKMLMKFACNSIYPWKTVPPIQVHIYSDMIRVLGKIDECLELMDMMLNAELKKHIIGCSYTRIDFAFDKAVNTNDYLLVGRHFRKSSVFNGSSNTNYFGSSASSLLAKSYNKKAQLMAHKAGISISQPYMTRFEVTLRKGKAIHIGNLHMGPNPWRSIAPAYIPALMEINPSFFGDMVPLFSDDGVGYWLKSFKPSVGRFVRESFRASVPNWWNPDQMWAECLALIENDPFINAL